MSADLLAEFGQESGSAQSSKPPAQTTRPPTNALIDGFDQSDEIFMTETSETLQRQHQGPHIKTFSSHYAPAIAASRQPAAYPAFDLPRPHDSDVLFDATEDTPASDAEDDDWGEFEGPEAVHQSQPRKSASITPNVPATAPAAAAQSSYNLGLAGTVDLLGGLSMTEPTSVPSQQRQYPATSNDPCPPAWDEDSFGDWGEFTESQSIKPIPPKPTQQPIQRTTPGISLLEDDSFGDWGDFADGPSTKSPPSKITPQKQPSIQTATPKKGSDPTKAASSIKPKAPTTKPFARPKPQTPAWEDDAFEDWADFNDGPAPSNLKSPPPRPSPSPPTTTKTTPSPQSFTSPSPALWLQPHFWRLAED